MEKLTLYFNRHDYFTFLLGEKNRNLVEWTKIWATKSLGQIVKPYFTTAVLEPRIEIEAAYMDENRLKNRKTKTNKLFRMTMQKNSQFYELRWIKY